jgi:hypothetical protein
MLQANQYYFVGFNVQFKHFKNELGEPDIKKIAEGAGTAYAL